MRTLARDALTVTGLAAVAFAVTWTAAYAHIGYNHRRQQRKDSHGPHGSTHA
jgi:hypothetical protein